MEQMEDRKMLKKSQNYFDHDHGKKTKRILYIYVVLGAGKFFKVFVFLQKKFVVVLRDYPYRVIKLLLRFSICPGKIIFLVEFCISFMTCDELQGVQDGLETF